MKTSASAGKLILGLLAAGLVFGISYWAAGRVRTGSRAATDELAWLGHEFQLTETETARIRTLHEGYKPQCEAMCARIAEKNRQLKLLLGGATNVSAEIEHQLAEIAALRAECQAQMLRHFQAVAQSMPETQGARYLAEMQRLTLGLQGNMEAGPVHATHEHP